MRALPVSFDGFRFLCPRNRWWIALVVVIFATGCAEKREEITKYRVLRKAADPLAGTSAAKEDQAPQKDTSPPVPTRMLAAMLPKGESTWFFKLSGPIEAVTPLSDTYRKFLGSVKFEGSTPKWTLPAGWTEGEQGNSMRFATLLIPQQSGTPQEVSVTRFPPNDPDLSTHLRTNLDRWRGQLGLAPLGSEDPAKAMTQISTEGGTVYLADLEGMMAPGGMGSGMGPFAKNVQKKKRGFEPPPDRPNLGGVPGAAPLTYTTPSGWKPGKVGAFSKAAFEVRDGDKKVDITITDLAPVGAVRDRLANVNRWRGEIDLPPITAEELPKQMLKFPIGRLTGDYVRLVGSPKDGRTILGVIVDVTVDKQETIWFFKLKGESALAAREKPEFESFVSSVKFSGAEGAEHGQ